MVNKKIIQIMGANKNSMKKVIVRAPILTCSGYGEHARFVMRALRKYEGDLFDIYALNINWGQTSWLHEDNEERQWLDQIFLKTQKYLHQKGQFDMSIQVTIPNEWQKMAPVNVGVTAGIEVNRISPVWVQKSQLMDRIIVVSEHAKKGFEETNYDVEQNGEVVHENLKCTAPVTVVHYPVKQFDPVDLGLKFETEFNFLAVAQWGARKNFDSTVDWFVEEYKNDSDVGLVLKTFTRNNSLVDRMETQRRLNNVLSKYDDVKCKVYLLHGRMTDQELDSLYKIPSIKCLVTLTHGEGFGLPIFEAAYNGVPVIAPDWSGHVDFLYAPHKDKKGKTKMKPHFARVSYSLSAVQDPAVWKGVIEKNSLWAFADKSSYKRRIREVHKDYSRFKSQAKKLQKWIFKNFKEEDKISEMAEAINGEKIVSISTEDLPKISIITSVYDGDKFIRPFLENITSQTIFKEKCELVLVNANSPGNEEETILAYKEKFPDNIIYKKLDEDPGIYATWNIALKMATGEYITNANLDDRKSLNSIAEHAKALYTDSEVDLVYADLWITDKPNETFEINSSNGRKYNFPQFSFDDLKMVNMPHNNPMWRKSMHERYGYFDEKYGSAGDWELWLRSAQKGSKFKKINKLLGLYYFNPTGISTTPENFDWKRKEEAEIFEKYFPLTVEE